MKLTEKELKRLAILVAREINEDKSYILEIDTRIKELETIHNKLTKEIDKYLEKKIEIKEAQI